MSDPKLKRTRVEISYGSYDGYRQTLTAKGGTGSIRPSTGQEVEPEIALLAGLEELARLTALFGFEDEALAKFNCARQKVAEWKAKRIA